MAIRSAGKSLFFSLVAAARNWRAFLTYSLAVGIIGIFVPRLLGALGGGGSLAAMFTVALSMVLLPTVYA